MQGHVWYNRVVPPQNEKKTIQIGVKIPESLYQILEEVCRDEDRPVGYVARELMVRGLALYRVDGRLRDELNAAGESNVIATIAPGSIEEARKLYQQNLEALTKSSSKVRKPPHIGEITDKNAQKKRKTG